MASSQHQVDDDDDEPGSPSDSEKNSTYPARTNVLSDTIITGKDSNTLSLKNLGITNLDFLSKYMRLNPDIVDVDLGDNKELADLEI